MTMPSTMLHASQDEFCRLAETYRRDERTDFLFAVWTEAFADADCTMPTDTAIRQANHARDRAAVAWNMTHG